MKKTDRQQPGRRHFLQQLLLIGGATGIGSTILSGNMPRQTQAQAQHTTGGFDDSAKGYHLTEHIRTYYDKARF